MHAAHNNSYMQVVGTVKPVSSVWSPTAVYFQASMHTACAVLLSTQTSALNPALPTVLQKHLSWPNFYS